MATKFKADNMSPHVLLLLLLLLQCSQFRAEDQVNDGALDRDPRLFNILEVVQSRSTACNTTTGDSGICFSAGECTSRGGRDSGTCASGFGVCCSFVVVCGETSKENNTYFVSEVIDGDFCAAKICRISESICQLRLDFDTFDIAQPTKQSNSNNSSISSSSSVSYSSPTTQCIDASFTVTSDGNALPAICGTNTGYHMIVEALETCNQLAFFTAGATTSNSPRSWKIKVSQIACDDPNKPPEGCAQYFTGASGTVQSYNFIGGSHLANQEYENCVRTEQGYCGISWTHSQGNFGLDRNNPGKNFRNLGDYCTTDYVVIPGGFQKLQNETSDRYCGDTLSSPTVKFQPATIVSVMRPFVLGVVTNSGEMEGIDYLVKGFSLDYLQKSC